MWVKSVKGYQTKQDMLHDVAVSLAGYAAEIMIFGKDNLTDGVSADFREATERATAMIKDLGMGERVGAFQVQDFRTNDYLPVDKELSNEIQYILNQALELCMETLEREKELLLQLANFLSDNRVLKKSEIKTLVEQYSALNPETDEATIQTKYFREHLKQMVSGLDNMKLKSA